MKKAFGILNAVLLAATLIGAYIYYEYGGIVLKGITCSGFVLIGAVNLIYSIAAKARSLKYPAVMALGLLVCMTGDVVLNIHFISGALVFMAGHMLYIVSYCFRLRFRARDLIPIGILALGTTLLVTVAPLFSFGSVEMELVCVIYGIVISCMLGKAVSNLIRERNAVNVILAVGSVLFFFSDLMLALNVFAGAPKITDTLCLFTYYPAQCLLAFSIFVSTKKAAGK